MQQNWKRRHAFVALEEHMVSSMLQPVFPGCTLTSLELLSAGNCNTNYKFTIAGLTDAFVLRIYVRDKEAASRDQHLFALIHERVPVPELLYVEPDEQQHSYVYAIMRFVDGVLFSDILQQRTDEAAITRSAYAIGRTLAAIGSFTFPQAGFFTPDLQITQPHSNAAISLPAYIKHFLFETPAGHRLGPLLTERLWQFIQDNAHYYSYLDGQSSLVHSDFKGFNILVQTQSASWQVTAILDWEFAFAGSPLFDVGNMLRYAHLQPPAFEQEFMQGFRDHGGQLPQEWKRIARLADLISLCQFLSLPMAEEALIKEVTSLILHTLEQW